MGGVGEWSGAELGGGVQVVVWLAEGDGWRRWVIGWRGVERARGYVCGLGVGISVRERVQV